MAPKRKNATTTTTTAEAAPTTTSADSSSSANAPTTTTTTHPPAAARAHSRSSAQGGSGWDKLVADVCGQYAQQTPQPTKLIDAFLAFLVAVGVLQFAYCVLAGNFPFNAFLSGFSATVGQFVLTASLRIQTIGTYKQEFSKISPERAFADYIVCSLILHFFCISYIN